ncbi:hypothetical protein CYLTODRAFT_431252 [Cylindrobasidium torrendii FP15055 ss-10]|uniref:Transcriptional regulatory protein RXT2 N-terminal domain-containing protein n=1 Tax=Cylindrobasidium torrendii FP15055 ss-10 TaxID=1314674 RepID=A0A0D7BBN2_9AGAR|nr:hypothetical protein CYLTODRAFT_431252 [Cylindrobasidium torrendii FP15055 ss-10]
MWYYPAHGYDSDCEPLSTERSLGNWGKKFTKDARWVRRGKMTAWGPAKEDWEVEERARKRIKLLLPQTNRSPSPPILPHLLDSDEALSHAPYPPPRTQHASYTSFVMDKAVTHTFRSTLLDELENSTVNLIEGEASMRQALGRLWQVISEEGDPGRSDAIVPKREDEDDPMDQREKRIARAPDLTPPIHRLFMFSTTSDDVPVQEPSHFASPETQLENLDKAVGVLRDVQDDGREYIERLQEIRENIAQVRAQRGLIWDTVRERAIKELQEAASAAAASA